jgi:hypothetical protein
MPCFSKSCANSEAAASSRKLRPAIQRTGPSRICSKSGDNSLVSGKAPSVVGDEMSRGSANAVGLGAGAFIGESLAMVGKILDDLADRFHDSLVPELIEHATAKIGLRH